MHSFLQNRIVRIAAGIIVSAVLFVLILRNGEATAYVAAADVSLEREAARIEPPPSAARVHVKKWGKSVGISATAAYSYRGTERQLIEHFDQWLRRDGWRFCHQWNPPIGGWVRYYEKAPYVIDLTYGGPGETYGYTFSVGVSHGECD
jgi:hypothetical protein